MEPWPKEGNVRRHLKSKERTSVYNVLRSIYEDSLLVQEVSDLLPRVPVLANLRCGAWYHAKYDGDCYFKSTDGHCNHWQFSFTRLNAHVARTAAECGGVLLIDSTKSSVKRTPDSFSRTVPIWCCVVNRALGLVMKAEEAEEEEERPPQWDDALHLPSWVSDMEASEIEKRLEGWSQKLASTQRSLLLELSGKLRRPLRALWLSEESFIWDQVTVEDREGFPFTPVYLLACSKFGEYPRTSSEKFCDFSWRYLRGAADDHESWAEGLTPKIFWSHHEVLLRTDPEDIDQVVEDLVKAEGLQYGAGFAGKRLSQRISSCSAGGTGISWIGNLGIGICSAKALSSLDAETKAGAACLNCSTSTRLEDLEPVKHIEVLPHKFDRFSLQNALEEATAFISKNAREGRRLVVTCDDGQDISPAVVAAYLLLFGVSTSASREECQGAANRSTGGKYTKEDVRSAVSCVTQYCPAAHPSRGSIKQVYNFLIRTGT
ncbi:initiator tRNA phosphoribosyl transferase [Chloropicon primus]|nr:initiator tRNA phosphoribosyl transferase [Chloropicon primus]